MSELYLDANQEKSDDNVVGDKETEGESPNLNDITVADSPNFVEDVNVGNPRIDNDPEAHSPEKLAQTNVGDKIHVENVENLKSVVEELKPPSPKSNVAAQTGVSQTASGILPNDSEINVDDGSGKDGKDVDEDSTAPVEKEMSSPKGDKTQVDGIEEDLVITCETIVHSTPIQSVAGRTRQRSMRQGATPVTALAAPSRTVTKSGCKPVLYGPPRTWSKGTPPNEKKKKGLKRKEVSSSDSEYDAEQDVAALTTTSRKKVRTRSLTTDSNLHAPLDNVSFHDSSYVSQWQFVYHRRLAVERSLSPEMVECTDLMDVIKFVGLEKTVTDLGMCYEMLVKEFLVNIGPDCDDPFSDEYRKVFVRGMCINFSPSVINQFLGRSDVDEPAIEVTDNEVCKTLT
jgi:hypothetical protein